MKKGVNCFHRLKRTKVSKDHFFPILAEDLVNDLIIQEMYEDGSIVDVNITQLMCRDFSEADRYQIFRYGMPSSKNEESFFEDCKKQYFANRKSDIALLIVDHFEETIFIVCGEIKQTLRFDSYYEAREQLISTYIDLNILSSIVTFNIYRLQPIFFTFSKESKIPKSLSKSSAELIKNRRKKIPSTLLHHEWLNKKIYYSLDLEHEIRIANDDISYTEDWPSVMIFFLNEDQLKKESKERELSFL